MSDSFTEVSSQGLGGNLIESIKGVAVGGLLFVFAFPVLWWNEGRPDLSQVAKKAKVVVPASVDQSAEGKLVALTGELKTTERIGDPEFLAPDNYVSLRRHVEMFAWTESKDSKTNKQLGGGSKTETTYSYDTKWTSSPKAPSTFRYPEGHENPSLPIQDDSFVVGKAEIGAYTFTPGDAELPSGENVPLTPGKLKGKAEADQADRADDADKTDKADKTDDAGKDSNPAAVDSPAEDKATPAEDDHHGAHKKGKKKRKHHGRSVRTAGPPPPRAAAAAASRRGAAIERRRPAAYQLASETYLFRGAGTLDRPKVGDIRISFTAVSPGQLVTLFGEQQGNEIRAYTYKGETRLFRVLKGTREEAVHALATEHKMITWILRAVGFLMMWFGLMMFFGPINALLDIIPFLGSAGRFLVGLVMLPVSIMLSTLVILLSIIFHSPVLLALTLAALGAGGYFLYQKKKKARKPD